MAHRLSVLPPLPSWQLAVVSGCCSPPIVDGAHAWWRLPPPPVVQARPVSRCRHYCIHASAAPVSARRRPCRACRRCVVAVTSPTLPFASLRRRSIAACHYPLRRSTISPLPPTSGVGDALLSGGSPLSYRRRHRWPRYGWPLSLPRDLAALPGAALCRCRQPVETVLPRRCRSHPCRYCCAATVPRSSVSPSSRGGMTSSFSSPLSVGGRPVDVGAPRSRHVRCPPLGRWHPSVGAAQHGPRHHLVVVAGHQSSLPPHSCCCRCPRRLCRDQLAAAILPLAW